MKLMPSEHNYQKFYDDYSHMQNMLFGEKPSFDIILQEIKKLEDEINGI